MSHNINIHLLTGKASAFFVKQPAWHGLGEVVADALTSEEAIIKAQMDYEVATTPVKYLLPGDNDHLFMTSRQITYRTDTKEVFEVVSDDYHIIQNRRAFKFFDAVVGKKEAIFQTAGVLGKGETIFITAKLPSKIVVGRDDVIDKYLLLAMSHNGKSAINVMFTPIRVVCNNTLTAALEGKDKLSIRHSAKAEEQLKQAHALLDIIAKESDSLQTILNEMVKVYMSDEEVRDYILRCMLTANEWTDLEKVKERKVDIVSTVYTYYFSGPGQREYVGTLYGAYNAITGYFNNVKEYKKAEARMNNTFSGDAFRISKFAMYYAVKLLKKQS